jgi:protease-4
MKKFLAAVLGLVVACALWLQFAGPGEPRLENGSTLVLDIDGIYVEAVSQPFLISLIGDDAVPFGDLRAELKKAARDDRISNVVLRIRTPELGWAQAQELRALLGELRAAGRRTVAYMETQNFVTNLPYYIASAADEIRAAPGSTIGLIGLSAEYLFLGGPAEALGIEFEVSRVGRYKTYPDMMTRKEMPEAYRESANSLLDSIFAQFVSGIADGRGVSEDFVREAIDSAPMSPEELLALGLIEGIGFLDETLASLGGARVDAQEYAGVSPAAVGFSPVAQFALIYASGTVAVGRGSVTQTGGRVASTDTVGDAFDQAANDPSVSAIVFRIDSPGGSPLAADIIWRAVERAKQHGKPVIASMSNAAASGGYYVAGGADAIVALPGTITGSIGVVALRPVIGALLEKFEIGVESLKRGRLANMFALSEPLSEAGRERFDDQIRGAYELFVDRVSAGRGMQSESVDAVARGRVWTGAQALEHGLIDALGGLDEAVRIAKEHAGIDEGDDVALIPFPPAKGLVEQINEMFFQARARAAPVVPLPGLLRRAQSWLAVADWEAPMLLPPFVVQIR